MELLDRRKVKTCNETPMAVVEPAPMAVVEPSLTSVVEPPPMTVVEPAHMAVLEPAPMDVVKPAPMAVVEPAHMAIVEPAHMAVVESSLTSVSEPAPMAVVEPAPMAVVKPAPMAVVEPAPMAAVEPAPMAVVEPPPLAVVEPAHMAVVEPAPMAIVEPVPMAVVEQSLTSVLKPAPMAVSKSPPTSVVNELPTALGKKTTTSLSDSIVIYNCNLCNVFYRTYYLLMLHHKIYHGVNVERETPTSKLMYSSVSVSHLPNICPLCKVYYMKISSLNCHLRSYHLVTSCPEMMGTPEHTTLPSSRSEPQCKCHLCNVCFSTTSKCIVHMNIYHRMKSGIWPDEESRSVDGSEQYVCRHCNAGFKDSATLQKHLDVYNAVKLSIEVITSDDTFTSIDKSEMWHADTKPHSRRKLAPNAMPISEQTVTPTVGKSSIGHGHTSAPNPPISKQIVTPTVSKSSGKPSIDRDNTTAQNPPIYKQIITPSVFCKSNVESSLGHGHISTPNPPTTSQSLYMCAICRKSFRLQRSFLDHKCSQKLYSMAKIKNAEEGNKNYQGETAKKSTGVKRQLSVYVTPHRNMRPKLMTGVTADSAASTVLDNPDSRCTTTEPADPVVLMPIPYSPSSESADTTELSKSIIAGYQSSVPGNVTFLLARSVTESNAIDKVASIQTSPNDTANAPVSNIKGHGNVTIVPNNTNAPAGTIKKSDNQTIVQNNATNAPVITIKQCNNVTIVQNNTTNARVATIKGHGNATIVRNNPTNAPVSTMVKGRDNQTIIPNNATKAPAGTINQCDNATNVPINATNEPASIIKWCDNQTILLNNLLNMTNIEASTQTRVEDSVTFKDTNVTKADSTTIPMKQIFYPVYNKVCDNGAHEREKPTEERSYTCYRCHLKYDDRSDFVKHHCKHGNTTIKRKKVERVECPLCHKSYYDRSTLNDHMKIHTGNKHMVCSYCDARFSKKCYLIRHLRKHPCECDLPTDFLCQKCEAFVDVDYGIVSDHAKAMKAMVQAAVLAKVKKEPPTEEINPSTEPGKATLQDNIEKMTTLANVKDKPSTDGVRVSRRIEQRKATLQDHIDTVTTLANVKDKPLTDGIRVSQRIKQRKGKLQANKDIPRTSVKGKASSVVKRAGNRIKKSQQSMIKNVHRRKDLSHFKVKHKPSTVETSCKTLQKSTLQASIDILLATVEDETSTIDKLVNSSALDTETTVAVSENDTEPEYDFRDVHIKQEIEDHIPDEPSHESNSQVAMSDTEPEYDLHDVQIKQERDGSILDETPQPSHVLAAISENDTEPKFNLHEIQIKQEIDMVDDYKDETPQPSHVRAAISENDSEPNFYVHEIQIKQEIDMIDD